MDPTQLTGNVIIDRGPLGMRVTCVQDIDVGAALFRVIGRPVPRPDKYSIQIAARLHLAPDGAPWSLVNHACAPNTAIDFSQWTLYAVRRIREGEELGWSYLTTEWALSCPFECACGAADCVRRVLGFKFLSARQRAALRPLLSPYLRRRFREGVEDNPSPACAQPTRTAQAP
ncbi:MAG: hypothetical protein JWL71_3925 [Acidobacteria bacterium]|nr:hypothetical protein [Acidobacteriota bacterium]